MFVLPGFSNFWENATWSATLKMGTVPKSNQLIIISERSELEWDPRSAVHSKADYYRCIIQLSNQCRSWSLDPPRPNASPASPYEHTSTRSNIRATYEELTELVRCDLRSTEPIYSILYGYKTHDVMVDFLVRIWWILDDFFFFFFNVHTVYPTKVESLPEARSRSM